MKKVIGILLVTAILLLSACEGAKETAAPGNSDISQTGAVSETQSGGVIEVKTGTVTEIGEEKLFVNGDSRQWGDRQMWVQTTDQTVFAYDDGQPATFGDIEVGMTVEFTFENGTMTMMLPPTMYGCIKVVLPKEGNNG